MPDLPAPKSIRGRRKGSARRLVLPRDRAALRDALATPATARAILLGVLFALLASAIVVYWLERPVFAPGRIMDATRVVRVDFTVKDVDATERERELRRQRAPRVYNADAAVLAEIESSLINLPATLAAVSTVDELAPEIRRFVRNAEQFNAVRSQAAQAPPDSPSPASSAWSTQVQRLMSELRRRPLLSSEEFQLARTDVAERLELRFPDQPAETRTKYDAISIDTAHLSDLLDLANRAGFYGAAADVVVQRLTADPRPTFAFDREATERLRDEEARGAPALMVTHRQGELIFRRGDLLTDAQRDLAVAEHAAFLRSLPLPVRVARWGGALGIMSLLSFALYGAMRLMVSDVLAGTWRSGVVYLLVLASAAATCWAMAFAPRLPWAAVVFPPLLAAMITIVAFHRRLAVPVAIAHYLICAPAMTLHVGYLVAVLAAVGIAAWRLGEIRTRADVVRASTVLGAGLAITVLCLSLLIRPTMTAIYREALVDAALAASAGFLAGALFLVILPGIERAFDVTTGMKLSELRDPRQPLLRLLQQRAPGTYNHSLSVATIAEAAADAIGANSLHVYVGALYHDIGKMNKPDYFVENQASGINKHNKLSPAMSLLVIVGHVKDGLELAREYALPRSLHHYIESHHGTTLVEYFFDRARRQAEQDDDADAPSEIEYRYPGPKPRTREAAILMICDAVESAARTMAEPTPARIEALVHTFAQRRLNDGQFDECELTLRELAEIERAITRTLCSIYHGRIAYPRADQPEASKESTRQREHTAAEQAG